MSSSIKLTNSSGKIVTITNPDTTSADVAVDLLNNAYTIATVDDFGTVPVGYTTVIVKDTDRGGIFVWSSTGTANGGTVFAGATGYWNRQYSGAVNVKWFGAKGDGSSYDSDAIQKAFDSHTNIFIEKTSSNYVFNKPVHVHTGNTIVTSNGATITSCGYPDFDLTDAGFPYHPLFYVGIKIDDINYLTSSIDNVSFSNLYFDNNPVTSYGIYSRKAYNVSIKNCRFTNFNSFPIFLAAGKNMYVGECYIENVTGANQGGIAFDASDDAYTPDEDVTNAGFICENNYIKNVNAFGIGGHSKDGYIGYVINNTVIDATGLMKNETGIAYVDGNNYSNSKSFAANAGLFALIELRKSNAVVTNNSLVSSNNLASEECIRVIPYTGDSMFNINISNNRITRGETGSGYYSKGIMIYNDNAGVYQSTISDNIISLAAANAGGICLYVSSSTASRFTNNKILNNTMITNYTTAAGSYGWCAYINSGQLNIIRDNYFHIYGAVATTSRSFQLSTGAGNTYAGNVESNTSTSTTKILHQFNNTEVNMLTNNSSFDVAYKFDGALNIITAQHYPNVL